MTDVFIFIIFGAIIIFDIFLAVRKKPTITDLFRRWYSQFIFVPFSVGFLFLGHFLDIIPNKVNVVAIIISGIIVLIISIILLSSLSILK